MPQRNLQDSEDAAVKGGDGKTTAADDDAEYGPPRGDDSPTPVDPRARHNFSSSEDSSSDAGEVPTKKKKRKSEAVLAREKALKEKWGG